MSVFYGSTVTRLFQGVASTLLGPSAMNGGARTALIGLAMHFSVALTWSTVFLVLFTSFAWIRDVVASPGGVVKVAAIYGPAIWMFMSFVVVRTLANRPPTINVRWWIQFFGHIPFVAVPIVASIAHGVRGRQLGGAPQPHVSET